MDTMTNTRTRAERLLDERANLQGRHENLIAEATSRDDGKFTAPEEEMVKQYRTRIHEIDTELGEINEVFENDEEAAKTSQKVRKHLSTRASGIDTTGDEPVYRTFASWARDKLVTSVDDIRRKVEVEYGPQFVQEAAERLMRAPAHTLSSDVGGLLPPQHITQIMAVIDTSRPVVASANRVPLGSGSITWPQIDQRPTVAKQGTEKTEVGSQKMIVTMQSESADTYLGAGNLSWQAINWSTPSALELFFRLLAEAYAVQTEEAACDVLSTAATSIGSPLAGTSSDTFEDWMAALLAGIAQVLDTSNATPNTLYLSRDMFFLAAGVTSDTRQMLITPGELNLSGLSGRVAGLNVVTSRGFDSGTAIVGDSNALIVAETPGAPVELRAVEPAIGGLEVGIIGGFIAKSFDDDRFADIGPTT